MYGGCTYSEKRTNKRTDKVKTIFPSLLSWGHKKILLQKDKNIRTEYENTRKTNEEKVLVQEGVSLLLELHSIK
jgi:hypothetical protein